MAYPCGNRIVLTLPETRYHTPQQVREYAADLVALAEKLEQRTLEQVIEEKVRYTSDAHVNVRVIAEAVRQYAADHGGKLE